MNYLKNNLILLLAIGGLILAIAGVSQAQPQLTVLPSAAPAGPPPSTLAQLIVDPNSQYVLDVASANVTIKNAQFSNPSTDLRAIGTFAGGNVSSGTSLQDPVNPAAVFAGGVGIVGGVCLCTGFLSDDEPTAPSPPAPLDVGVQGANNGFPIDPPGVNHEGEVSKEFETPTPFSDDDFRAVHSTSPVGGDPAVLSFDIDLDRPGFLRVSFVFGSDEYPAWIEQPFNDTFVILVKGRCTPENHPGENLATFIRNGVSENFSLQALEACPPLFRKNNMSPASVAAFPNTVHDIPGAPYYDHEFGGFSKVLTRETVKPLAPGTYTVKFVVEDVADRVVDAALFVPTASLKLFPVAHGDYNGSGCVDQADYDVWRAHFGQTSACYYDGDGNGDGAVNSADYVVWRNNLGNSGNTDFRADFNRDGQVNGSDLSILGGFYEVLDECASRFEGDADEDGDVDGGDLGILAGEYGLTSCGCDCGGESPMANDSISLTALKEQLPESADADGDGDVDEEDFAIIDGIIAKSKMPALPASETDSASEGSPSTTLAE